MSGSARDLLARDRVLVIAHRGASADAPENTVPAFRRALEAGADLVEFDYHHTRDGRPVVVHDETLDRTTDAVARWGGAELRVDAFAASELGQLDAGAWFHPRFRGTRLPSLAQALDVIRDGAIALIERKAGDAETLAASLEARGLVERVVVQSFDGAFLAACRRRCPGLVLGVVGEGALPADRIEEACAAGAAAVAWQHEPLDGAAVRAAHARGLALWAWTVNDVARARALRALGVDGLITDRPATLRAALG